MSEDVSEDVSGSVDRAGVLREVAEIAFEAASAGLWVAAEELDPGGRRAARVGLTLAAGGYAWWRSTRAGDEPTVRTVGTVATATLGAASPMVRRLVGPRWLRRLEELGVAHPYRALGRRVALASFAVGAATRFGGVVR